MVEWGKVVGVVRGGFERRCEVEGQELAWCRGGAVGRVGE
jgi:hypothetical protein